jgi:hypothetical protein
MSTLIYVQPTPPGPLTGEAEILPPEILNEKEVPYVP